MPFSTISVSFNVFHLEGFKIDKGEWCLIGSVTLENRFASPIDAAGRDLSPAAGKSSKSSKFMIFLCFFDLFRYQEFLNVKFSLPWLCFYVEIFHLVGKQQYLMANVLFLPHYP